MNIIDVKYAKRFLQEVPLREASTEMLEMHTVACRLLDQLNWERDEQQLTRERIARGTWPSRREGEDETWYAVFVYIRENGCICPRFEGVFCTMEQVHEDLSLILERSGEVAGHTILEISPPSRIGA